MEIGKKEEKKKKKERKGEEEKMSEKLHLISRFYGDRTVGSGRSKRKSWSTQRELCVGTKISGFLQTPRCRGFSPTRFNSCLRVI